LWLGRQWSVELLDLEAASRVRMYSLRKACWMSSFRYFRKAKQWVVLCSLQLIENEIAMRIAI